jgi:undecaprenyl-diphosphatase
LDGYQGIILGIAQGLTEFLPVSSSGHLVLLQNIFGLTEPELLFDVAVHIGTLVAVCGVFFKDIFSILKSLFTIPASLKSSGSLSRLIDTHEDLKMVWMIIVGSLPTAIIGLLFSQIVDQIFGAIWIVGAMLLITGTILWLTRGSHPTGRPIAKMTAKDALIIGLVQGLAILPGISRSGSTISAALFLGLDRKLAGRFSFLLSIPAIFGALILSLDISAKGHAIPLGTTLAGMICSAVVGTAALLILLRMVNSGKLYRFSPYCWLLGAVALGWSLL